MNKIILACSVCFGNADSWQSKGVVAGVLFLMGVIGVVLAGIGLTIFRWNRHARHCKKSATDSMENDETISEN